MPDACELLGLSRNPFRSDAGLDLACHVEQDADRAFWAAQRDSLYGRDKAVVALVGGEGAGKSHRLDIAAARAAKAGSFCVRLSAIGLRPDALVARLAAAVLAGYRLGPLQNALAAPKWYRSTQALAHQGLSRGDPEVDGAALARAVNANIPAFVLLDDLHALPFSRGAERYLVTLESLQAHLDAGALLAWTCDETHLEALLTRFPRLRPRTPAISLAPLNQQEASHLIGQRLQACRVVDGLPALYPFSPEAVARMVAEAGGNPRRLLRLAELAIEACPRAGPYEIGAERMEAFLELPLVRRDRRRL